MATFVPPKGWICISLCQTPVMRCKCRATSWSTRLRSCVSLLTRPVLAVARNFSIFLVCSCTSSLSSSCATAVRTAGSLILSTDKFVIQDVGVSLMYCLSVELWEHKPLLVESGLEITISLRLTTYYSKIVNLQRGINMLYSQMYY
jgi:hypothetical protein